jgi:hypothetical protein
MVLMESSIGPGEDDTRHAQGRDPRAPPRQAALRRQDVDGRPEEERQQGRQGGRGRGEGEAAAAARGGEAGAIDGRGSVLTPVRV